MSILSLTDSKTRLRPDIRIYIGEDIITVPGDDVECRPTRAFLWPTADGIKLLKICQNCGYQEVSENAPNYKDLHARAPFPKPTTE